MSDPFMIPHGWMEEYERIAFWSILRSKELRNFFCFAFFFFLTAANLRLFVLKNKKTFWGNSHNFYYFGKKKLGPDVICLVCQS